MRKEIFDDNKTLLIHLKNGDDRAYAFLIERYNHKLCVYANSILNDVLLTKDVVQNVFIKIWERRDFLSTDLSLKSYLYKSVYNSCINEFKKNQSVTSLEKKYIEGIDLVVQNEDTDTLERLKVLVKDAIQELPPKCKQVFILSKKEGLTNLEISEYLNLSVNTVERHITIAFFRIKEYVGKKADFILFLLFRTLDIK